MKHLLTLLLASSLSALAQQPAAPAAPAPAPVPAEQEAPLTTAELFGDDPLAPAESEFGSATSAIGARPTGPVDPDLPQPFDPSVLTQLVDHSPFTRLVSVSDSLVLTGVAYVDGKPVVTLFDKDKKESLVVTSEPNMKGWTLIEATQSIDIKRASAKINIGGEPVSIRYDAAALTPEAMKKDKKGDRGDRGPPPGGPPGGGDKFSRGGRGPSEEDRKKFESLSESAKDKFRNGMREMFNNDKFRNASEDDRRNAIRSMFDKIQKEDQKR
ncbi:MAG: hypothetical protein IPK32_17040 [Verrucomicrobiaceae bacterium]|nr:hypothetical protein [Verrucomicrobiaceae bacterium]